MTREFITNTAALSDTDMECENLPCDGRRSMRSGWAAITLPVRRILTWCAATFVVFMLK